MFAAFANSFKIPELRKRILFTLGIILLCRLIATVPTPGVNALALQQVMESMSQSAGGSFLGWINLFSGGALAKCAVGALGIMPYISASIIIQLMTAVLPNLERLVQEGESGRMKITQYTRYLTLVICVIQALSLAVSLQNPGVFGIKGATIVENPGFGFIFLTIVAMTTATMFMMWLGEQITEYGLGNGISIIITINIVSRMPNALIKTMSLLQSGDGSTFGIWHLVFLAVMFFLVTAGTVMLTQGLRKIPINSTRKVVGNKSYGGGTSYMPLRVNFSGVMPIIFAQALLAFPVMLLGKIEATRGFAKYFQMGEPLYLLLYTLMILFFSYFWVSTQFNPMKIADDLKKNGAYVPGIRPGKPTADFLDITMTRLTLAGAIALTVIAVLPTILSQQLQIPWEISQFMGGTSLLIMVGVTLETVRQMESHLVMRNYDGFLKSGKIRSARG
ncbi:MAG: preprotein translocase subunit SecY [Kiritimatiellae bacterium]|jgi:preprotein translocase subunit SecY|nr:preprotein translocase subunit SecY [Kiritimatiellia bacterium]